MATKKKTEVAEEVVEPVVEEEPVPVSVAEEVPVLEPIGVEPQGEVELKIPVAPDAGVWSLAPLIAAHKGLYHQVPELSLIVIDIVIDANPVTDLSGIISVLLGAAGAKKVLSYHVIFI